VHELIIVKTLSINGIGGSPNIKYIIKIAATSRKHQWSCNGFFYSYYFSSMGMKKWNFAHMHSSGKQYIWPGKNLCNVIYCRRHIVLYSTVQYTGTEHYYTAEISCEQHSTIYLLL